MLRSLKLRFMAVLLFMLISIASLATIQYTYSQKINHLYESQLALKELSLKYLQMKFAEANFLLSFEKRYVNDVEVYANTMDSYFEIVDDYLNEFTYTDTLSEDINLYLETFDKLQEVEDTHSLEFKERIFELSNYSHIINTYIENEKNRLIPLISTKIDNIILLQGTIYLLMALLTIFMIIIVFKPIINSILILKEFFASYKDSNERLNIDRLYFNEVKNIAMFVNKMLDNQESIQKELLLARDEALRSQKVKDEFLSNMSHELRTPLNAIGGFAGVLLRKLPHESETIDPIIDSSAHLLQLVGDILDLSKIQSGKFEIVEEAFEVYEELLSFKKRFKPLVEKKNITLHCNFEADKTLYLQGDWFRISQILNNFMSNAIKFTPQDGTITLVISYKEGVFFAGVTDTGIGINKNAIEKIANPFEQSDSSITKRFGGTGLGLSIAKTLTQMMNGEFNIQSVEGEGSTFSVSLPLQSVQKKIENPDTLLVLQEESEEEIIFNAHALIAEDNKTNQLLLSMLLDDLEITYDIANDGQEAVDIFEENKFDMILMDENMPKLSGTQAMLKIHELFTKVPPIIAVTANAMKGDKDRLIELGMDDFLSKPIDNDLLIEVIRRNLAKKS